MRVMESNFRGFRSESGIRMENSDSSAAIISASEKESRSPDSKSDSPGAGSIGLSARRWMMATILLRLSIWLLVGNYRAGLFVSIVGTHQVLKQRFGQAMIAGGREVDVVALGETRVYPILHGTLAAHAFSHIPKRAAI